MAGYNGFSMSNNAVVAYATGEKPLSKWTKKEILSELGDIDRNKYDLIKKAPLKACRKLLYCSSWHHTSLYYNKTDFYSVDIEEIENMTVDQLADLLITETKQEPDERRVYAHYLVWSGTRKHPKATEMTAYGVIKGNWFYLDDGTKKSITANGFYVIEG